MPVLITAGAVIAAAIVVVVNVVIKKKKPRANSDPSFSAAVKPKMGAVIICEAGVFKGNTYNFDDVIT